MKKRLFILLVCLLAVNVVSSQAKRSATRMSKAGKTRMARKRVKFDPKRVPKDDLEKAKQAAAKTGKRIILDVGGEWCAWCIHMDSYIAAHRSLARLRDQNFIWMKVNSSEENENKEFLSAYPEIEGYPHLFILDETGKLLHSEDTSELEEKETYNLAKFTAFLKTWAPEHR